MDVVLTNTQKLYKDTPTRLDLLRELNKRNALIHNDDLQKELERLERGLEGERILIEYIEKNGEEHWTILKNVWFNYFGRFECDLLLLTTSGIYAFEVKNYSGTFELKNNVSTINGNAVGKSAISQAQNITTSLNKILHESINKLQLSGAVAFVNADNIVNIYDQVSDLSIIKRNKLRKYIWEISQTDRNYSGYPIKQDLILKALEKYETVHPYPPDNNLPNEVFNNIQKGIRCSHCGSFSLNITKKYISCDCGMHESREEAIVRTICEYGVINYKDNFTTTELTDFFNGEISRDNIKSVLIKFFEQIGSYKNTKYINKMLPFIKIYNEFVFTSPKYLVVHGPVVK